MGGKATTIAVAAAMAAVGIGACGKGDDGPEAAASSTATTTEHTFTITRSTSEQIEFPSAAAAARWATGKAGFEAAVPPALADTAPVTGRGSDSSAQLTFPTGDGTPITLRYGQGIGFDGCDLPPTHRVEIGGARGLESSFAAGKDGRVYDLIWPATRAHPSGLLGLQAQLPERKVLKLARGMTLPEYVPGYDRKPDC